MIEIKKITDPERKKQISERYAVELEPEHSVIATIEGDEILQCAVFSYSRERGAIHLIEGFGNDMDLLDGLCRAILNIMDINGVKEVYLPEMYMDLAKKVGFSTEDSGFKLKLEGFFCCGCSCKR